MALPRVSGLPEQEAGILAEVWKKWVEKAPKNHLMNVYADGHRAFSNLGISVPPQMARTRAALGWPAKAVGALARKHVFQGFSLDGTPDPFEVSEMLARNEFETALPQAIYSAYKQCCAFVSVTAGDTESGDPPVMIDFRDALWSAGLWDWRRRSLRAVLAITDTDMEGLPTSAILYVPWETWRLEKGLREWSATALGNRTGRILVNRLPYDPQLGRPFGRSRISPEVRYLTDAAIRTMVRTETSAEFFSSPQRWIMGADLSQFEGQDRWSAIMGRFLAVGPNEDGQIPEIGQFAQMSMEPHLSMYRQLAQNFCAATNLPQASVGIFADNPASAEAMQAAEYALSDEAEYQWRIFTSPLRSVLQDVVMVRDNLTEVPEETWRVGVKYTPPRYVSPQAASDYVLKVSQALPDISGTTVVMRRAGFSEEEILEIRAEQRRAQAGSVLDRLTELTRAQQPVPGEAEQAEQQDGDAAAGEDATQGPPSGPVQRSDGAGAP